MGTSPFHSLSLTRMGRDARSSRDRESAVRSSRSNLARGRSRFVPPSLPIAPGWPVRCGAAPTIRDLRAIRGSFLPRAPRIATTDIADVTDGEVDGRAGNPEMNGVAGVEIIVAG